MELVRLHVSGLPTDGTQLSWLTRAFDDLGVHEAELLEPSLPKDKWYGFVSVKKEHADKILDPNNSEVRKSGDKMIRSYTVEDATHPYKLEIKIADERENADDKKKKDVEQAPSDASSAAHAAEKPKHEPDKNPKPEQHAKRSEHDQQEHDQCDERVPLEKIHRPAAKVCGGVTLRQIERKRDGSVRLELSVQKSAEQNHRPRVSLLVQTVSYSQRGLQLDSAVEFKTVESMLPGGKQPDQILDQEICGNFSVWMKVQPGVKDAVVLALIRDEHDCIQVHPEKIVLTGEI